MKEVRRQPVQIHPQRPPVTEIDDGDRPHAQRRAGATERLLRRSRYACRRPRFGSLSSSAAVTARMLRRDVAEIPDPRHHPEQADDSRARRTSRARSRCRSATATIGGVSALPRRAKACVIPWAKPRRPATSTPASRASRPETSRLRRRPTSAARGTASSRLPAKPVRIVADAQISPHTKSVLLGPTRSPSQPPKI